MEIALFAERIRQCVYSYVYLLYMYTYTCTYDIYVIYIYSLIICTYMLRDEGNAVPRAPIQVSPRCG